MNQWSVQLYRDYTLAIMLLKHVTISFLRNKSEVKSIIVAATLVCLNVQLKQNEAAASEALYVCMSVTMFQ